MGIELCGYKLTEIAKNKYKVEGNECPDDMIVTIRREKGGYRAECNYAIRRGNAANAYQAMHLRPTAEETLKHLLISLIPGKDAKWEKVKIR